jgi:propionyl-CoA carboxylase beta chain
MEDPLFVPPADDTLREEPKLAQIIPDEPNKPYDMKEIIDLIVDDGYFYEIHADYAQNIVVGFARLGGHSVGIVANQPAVLAGVLDIHASKKAARFIRLCDCFNIPIITFVRCARLHAWNRPRTQRDYHGRGKSSSMLIVRRPFPS